MNVPSAATAGLVFLLSLLASSRVLAADSYTAGRTTAFVGARRGFALAKGVTATPWAYGIGARLGYTLRGGLYLGLQADTYLFDRGIERYPGTEPVVIRGKLGAATVQFGHDWGLLDRLSLRWTAGLGAAWGSFETCELETTDEGESQSVCTDAKNPRAVLSTEVGLLARVSRHVVLGGSGQWLVDTGFFESTTGGVIGLDVGWRF